MIEFVVNGKSYPTYEEAKIADMKEDLIIQNIIKSAISLQNFCNEHLQCKSCPFDRDDRCLFDCPNDWYGEDLEMLFAPYIAENE